MGVIGFGSALAATAWNYVYNLGFDHAMQRLAGHTRKSLGLRVAHALLFEAGLLMVLLPPIAWYLGIGLYEAFVMDLAIAAFYVVYAFVFNLAYDRVFPIPAWQQQTPA
ncbi:PACE efflux transporter [Pseudoroseomonas wenyumeiae]